MPKDLTLPKKMSINVFQTMNTSKSTIIVYVNNLSYTQSVVTIWP